MQKPAQSGIHQAPAGSLVIGRNVSATVEGEDVVIRFRHATRLGASKSGKNVLVATTGGNVTLSVGGAALKVGLNVYEPAEL